MKPFSLLWLIAPLLALFLTGCEPPRPKAAPTPTPSPTPTPAPEPHPAQVETDEPKELKIFVWSEYVPQGVIDAFSEETGIAVTMETYSSNEEMLAKLLAEAGDYDLIQPSDYTVQALVEADLLDPLDKERIPNLEHIDPFFLDQPFDPGNRYTVPWMAGLVGIVYNSEKISAEIDGFEDVFQPAHRQRIVVLDDPREIVSWALAARGIPVNEITPETLRKVRPLLAEWLPMVAVFDSDSPREALLGGTADIGIVWNGEAAKLLAESEKFRWVVPEKGAHLFIDSLAIPKGADHPDNAMAFMNFVLRPEISQQISERFPYLNPNTAARELLPEAARSNPASFPPRTTLEKLEVFEDLGEMSTEIDELVTPLKVQ